MWRWLSVLPLALAMGPAAAADLRYLALGDSYTIGEGVPEAGRWPAQLGIALRAKGLALAAPRYVARTGWTTDELATAMDAEEFAPPYDLVSLLIGVNNQYRGRDPQEYQREFAALLARAIALAGGRSGRVFVLSIPDWGVTPFAAGSDRDAAQVARELDAYNALALVECRRMGVAFVDITPLSRGVARAELTGDGLHPSDAQYARWASTATPVVAALLAPPARP
jgi:lysophospholipase L1-like esterase